MNLDALLKKAAKAPVPSTGLRSSYRQLVPVIETLQARGYPLKGAVRWLVQEKQIAADNEEKAYSAIRQLMSRRARK